MARQLREAGFVNVRRCAFNDSEDPMFKAVEERGRFVDETNNLTELAMECRKPSRPIAPKI